MTTESRVLHACVTDAPLEIAVHERLVLSDWAGAQVTFAGVVRDHDGGRDVVRLRYEAHPDASDIMVRVAEQVANRHVGVYLAATHRVGDLGIGDAALVVAVASAHRAEAFAACAELVDEIKAQLPVWKLQVFADGTREWVGSA